MYHGTPGGSIMGLLLVAISLFVVATTAAVTAVAITATSRPAAEVVSPYGDVGLGCPAADTLNAYGTETELPQRNTDGWRVTTLHSLADVESFMDYLENHNVSDRELHIVTGNSFAVRWRSA
jgi:hypothetical protein